MSWNPRSLPSLTGKRYVVTGGSSGIGFFTIKQQASAVAEVVPLARSAAKADVAIARVRRVAPSADLSFIAFDLSSLVAVDRGRAEAASVRLLLTPGLRLTCSRPGGRAQRTAAPHGGRCSRQRSGDWRATLGALAAAGRCKVRTVNSNPKPLISTKTLLALGIAFVVFGAVMWIFFPNA